MFLYRSSRYLESICNLPVFHFLKTAHFKYFTATGGQIIHNKTDLLLQFLIQKRIFRTQVKVPIIKFFLPSHPIQMFQVMLLDQL